MCGLVCLTRTLSGSTHTTTVISSSETTTGSLSPEIWDNGGTMSKVCRWGNSLLSMPNVESHSITYMVACATMEVIADQLRRKTLKVSPMPIGLQHRRRKRMELRLIHLTRIPSISERPQGRPVMTFRQG